MNTTRDAALLSALCEDRGKSFDNVIREYYPSMLAYANSKISDISNAKLVVLDCFVAFWEKKSHLQVRESLRGMLFVSLVHRCSQFLEKETKRERAYREYVKERGTAIGEIDPTLEKLIGHESADTIYNNLLDQILANCKKLPPQQYATLISIYFEKNSYQATADKFGKSLYTIQSNLSRAIRNLKRFVKR